MAKPPVLTTTDYQTRELYPFKCQAKIIDALIANSTDKRPLLILFLGMLIGLIIKLIILSSAKPDLIIAAYRLQDEYIEFQVDQHEFDQQGSQLNSSRDESAESSAKIETETKKPKNSRTPTIWQNAVSTAADIFVKLTRIANDTSLDNEEKLRAIGLIDKILEPYRQLTKYFNDYEAGTLQYDVIHLLLLKKPKDYKMRRQRWTIRDISWVCKNILQTKSASKSQIGRFLKEIKWNCAIRPKMLSSDSNYGKILLELGLIFNSLKKQDVVLFGDEFKYTSSKVAEYLKLKTASAGLNIALPFSLHKPFYKTKAAIQLSGILNGKTKDLKLKKMADTSFESYYQITLEFLEEIFEKKVEGTVYLILDNARYHSPQILRKRLHDKFGERIQLIFLPRYAPNHNPIERIWKFLLEATERCGNSEEELREYLQNAVEVYETTKTESDLNLHCGICGTKWIFTLANQESNDRSLKKHLCFQIKDINPYVMYVLINGLETMRLTEIM